MKVFAAILSIIPIIYFILKFTKIKEIGAIDSKTKIFILASISIILVFGLGIFASYKGYNYLNNNYCLPFWISSILTFLTIVLVMFICGLAVSFITPMENKKLAYAIALTSFLCLGLGAGIHYYRGDYFNFDGTTNKGITPSTNKIWGKSYPKCDPTTGEEIVPLTKDMVRRIKLSLYTKKLSLSANGTQSTGTFKKTRDLNINISGNADADEAIVELHIPGIFTMKVSKGDYPCTVNRGERFIFSGVGVCSSEITITEVQ